MSSKKYFRPGPRPTRCLTCWQRRKKCDLNRPSCERCLQGGFECLGYGDRESRERTYQRDLCAPNLQHQDILPTVPVKTGGLDSLLQLVTSDIPENVQLSDGTNMESNASSLIPEIGIRRTRNHSQATYMDTRDCATMRHLDDFNRTWPQNQTQPTHSQRNPLCGTPSAKHLSEANFDIQSIKSCIVKLIESLFISIPPPIISAQTIAEARFAYMLNDYQMQRTSSFFMPPPSRVHAQMANRLKSSMASIWTLYLGVRLFGALSRDPNDREIRAYTSWINTFEQRLITPSAKSSSPKDLADRLMAQLELAYLGFVAVDNTLGYGLFRKALPVFLRLVATDPNLVAEHSNGALLVSFPRTFGASLQEIKRFVVYDTATAFILGVPSLIEYNYDGTCDTTSHGSQWIHGVPVPLVEIISQINSWRNGSRTRLDNWDTLERRALAWEIQLLPIDGDSRMNVARLAIQEGWKHVVLIYIYMGMCGVSSDDSRVQASITQIIQLGGSVTGLSIDIHMLMHYVVAGLGARYEQQRSAVREKLLSFKGKRIWLFRGPEFSQVLDHLWHGVGAGGAPVVWNDYVHSRSIVLRV
ncbi:hypothetical protein RSOLAG1IB_07418 [Rhizoctonia solani AG-1 IB]|uniref:Zn(2)-C6 fungal-type domain-containing protein n=1 Tax=Thanatephorus cucumeris (strain AG1-IB / isolate 7/3/14) TaxID=1108050 RepID=A0A0B7FA27_THACB|nr:hypothetical protein RSOLAG1IB_07418 [Rhizoctonia solani AG-1 IB]